MLVLGTLISVIFSVGMCTWVAVPRPGPPVPGGPYEPGTPGANWNRNEMIAIRGQLTAILQRPYTALFKVPGGPVTFLEGKVSNWKTITGRDIYMRYARGDNDMRRLRESVIPNIAKFVRLSFHDCLQDTETGGCNGCLNFRNMGVEGTSTKDQGCHKTQTCPHDHHTRATDNNNLLWVARVLEILYTETKFPFSRSSKFQLRKSLRDSGKSRADLWAFAGLVAMESSSQINNKMCTPKGEDGLCPGQFDERSPPCNYNLPKLVFKTGRRDCIPTCTGANSFYGFCSTASEQHPDPLANGKAQADFLKDTFNFTAKESVAIFGAHSLGHATEQISGFRHYPWTSGGFDKILTNNYYKQMANPGMYRVLSHASIWNMKKCDLKLSTFVGDEYGNPITASWQVRSELQNNDGGAWNWNPFGMRCDATKCSQISTSEMSKASCCRQFGPEGLDCKNNGRENKCRFWCDPSKDRFKCRYPTFMQSSYLNCDMGLFLKFDSDEATGRPSGCSGLNVPQWLSNKWRHPRKAHGCPLNDMVDNQSGMQMHEVVELFANDQQTWINDFVPAFQKMQENGYASGNLIASPDGWQGLVCNNRDCRPL